MHYDTMRDYRLDNAARRIRLERLAEQARAIQDFLDRSAAAGRELEARADAILTGK